MLGYRHMKRSVYPATTHHLTGVNATANISTSHIVTPLRWTMKILNGGKQHTEVQMRAVSINTLSTELYSNFDTLLRKGTSHILVVIL